MRSRIFVPATVLAVAFVIASCSSGKRASFDGDGESDAGSNIDPTQPPLGRGGPEAAATHTVNISGTVYAPNGDLPVAGALIYLTKERPVPIPSEVYCDKCITLQEGTFAYSGPDGSFRFDAKVTTEKFVVVQKGQFRRVRPITIGEGEIKLDKEQTTFPKRADTPIGDDTPRIAVLQSPLGPFDHVEDALKELGIEDFTLLPRSPSPENILASPEKLAKYHIVLIPCRRISDTENIQDETIKKNLRDYVSAGGKVYVTDYAYEYVRQAFPGFITWRIPEGRDAATFGAATNAKYNAPAVVRDPGLKAWLDAQGHTEFDLEDNWTIIDKVSPQPGKDENGKDVQITPKVWVEGTIGGQPFPTSVTFQHQCGRVLFSTYHTEANAGGDFLPQEKALFHVVLEVGVCLGELPGGGPR